MCLLTIMVRKFLFVKCGRSTAQEVHKHFLGKARNGCIKSTENDPVVRRFKEYLGSHSVVSSVEINCKCRSHT